MWIPKIALKGFYNFMLCGLPSVTYNPLYKESIFHAPVKIDSTSTYINYKIPKNKFNIVNKYIKKYNRDLSLIPTRIASDQAEYYISINIYNCTSPIFNSVTTDPVTRCEVNTYVVNGKGEEGTLIMDYSSNFLSLDPVNIFKDKGICNFKKYRNKYSFNAENDNFKLSGKFLRNEDKDFGILLNKKIIAHTDNIFYLNGIYDKLYYDSSLVKSSIRLPNYVDSIKFKFLDIEFNHVDSIFYFADPLNFVGAIWSNLYDN